LTFPGGHPIMEAGGIVMFGPLGVPELLFILALALLIFGPRKLPEIGRTLGRGMSEFRKASNELRRTLNAEVVREELRQNDPRRILKEAIDEPPAEKRPPKKPSKKAPDDAEAPSEGPGGTVARGGAADPSAETPAS